MNAEEEVQGEDLDNLAYEGEVKGDGFNDLEYDPDPNFIDQGNQVQLFNDYIVFI